MKIEKINKINQPQRIISYFKIELFPITLVTVSGVIYNIGMTAGPFYEGQMVQCLYDIMNYTKNISEMIRLVMIYLGVILLIQGMRCIKRFYVRRFANDTSRNMRHMIYNSMIYESVDNLSKESTGSIMTKALSDVDVCVEGMRKFTTEIFDTGVVMVSYFTMLLFYDYKLTLISSVFTIIAYYIAAKLKKIIAEKNAMYKKSLGELNNTTMDRLSNLVTYRVFGCDEDRNRNYDNKLVDFESKAIQANIWKNTMQPIYNIISVGGVILIIYFGAKNVLGNGWTQWNIAAFTTYLACYTKLALKASKAAKLFNAVQSAEVSWKRIKPLMQEYIEPDNKSTLNFDNMVSIKAENLSVSFGDNYIFKDVNFEAAAGDIIGVTGVVASGKSTFGKIFLMEFSYEGSILIGDSELKELSEYERSRLITYMGHNYELMSGSLAENIRLGGNENIEKLLNDVCFYDEVANMPDKVQSYIGNSGAYLSGGQQARTALARMLYQDTPILVLDDPFSALDYVTEDKIINYLKSISKNKIIFLISHRLRKFPELSKVLWTEDSKMILSTHNDLISKNKNYSKLYFAQTEGAKDD